MLKGRSGYIFCDFKETIVMNLPLELLRESLAEFGTNGVKVF